MSLRKMLTEAGHVEGRDFTIESEHVVAIDASCSCGATLRGAWSGDEVDAWQESHRKEPHE